MYFHDTCTQNLGGVSFVEEFAISGFVNMRDAQARRTMFRLGECHSRATTKKILVHCIHCEHSHLVERREHQQSLLGSDQQPAGLFAIQQ
jgi:hypothetical protein